MLSEKVHSGSGLGHCPPPEDGERAVNVASLEINRARGVEVDGLPTDRDSAVSAKRALNGKLVAVDDRLGLAVHGHCGACWEGAGEGAVRLGALIVAALALASNVQESD